MRKLLILIILSAGLFLIISCSTTYDKNISMRGDATLVTEANVMWSRPTEVGYEIIGDVEGTAEFSKLFGIIPLGDSPAADLTGIFGTGSDNAGVRYAAYDAIKSIGADGIYITSTYYAITQGIVTTEKVTIKGKALKLIDLGAVDKQRADTVRYLSGAKGLDTTNLAPNIGGSGIFSPLGSIFSFGF